MDRLPESANNSTKRSIFLRNLPKVEIHLHLEGAIPLAAIWELASKYRLQKELGTFEELKNKFRYRDFAHFIETWIWLGRFLKEYDDYRFIAEAVSQDLASQNIKYAEMFFSPSRDSAKHLNSCKITEAIFHGLEKHGTNVTIRLIADGVRDNGPDEMMRMVEKMRDVKDLGVVGIGVGGTESMYPAEPFETAFERARHYGFRTTIHAGEALGAESIWAAIRRLKVDRIGHGTRARDDVRLVEYLRNDQIPLEMCPISNLRTGVVPRMSDHPVEEFYRKGLKVCVNTDDPTMFNTSLEGEFSALMDTFGFEERDVAKLTENAIDSSWGTPAEKENLKKSLADYVHQVSD